MTVPDGSYPGKILYRRLDARTDVPAWLELHKVCFQWRMDHEAWNWIHRENPFYKKTTPLVIVAECEGRIVGSVSLIPTPLQRAGGEDPGYLSSCFVCKAMVDPAWRQRGIFSSLLKSALQLAKEEEYDVLLTIANNPYSVRTFLNTGFTFVTDFIQTKRYISLDFLLKSKEYTARGYLKKMLLVPAFCVLTRMYPRIRHDYEVRYSPVLDVAKEIEQFHSPANSYPGIQGLRTKPFILWRFGRTDLDIRCLTLWKKNRLCAYLIHSYSETKKNGVILDLFTGKNDALTGILVNEVIRALSEDHAGSLSSFQLDRDGDISRTFSPRFGFFQRYSLLKHGEQSHFLQYWLDEKTGRERPFDKNSWNIQAADTCLFPVNQYI